MNKNCKSVFDGSAPLNLSNPDFAAYRQWKPAVLEKAFFILHVLGLLLAGLATPGQNVMWFTDEDSIAANDDRVRNLTRLFEWISSQYLTFNLGHCRCGTSKCDDGSQQIEDFLAIPDIVAGALAEQLQLRNVDPYKISDVFWIHRNDFSNKTQEITWWLSQSDNPLKRFLCITDPSTDGKGNVLRFIHFQDKGRED